MSRSKWTGALIDDDLDDAIHYLAIAIKESPKTLMTEIVRRGVETMAKELKNPPLQLRVWRAVCDHERTDRTRMMLDELGRQAKIENDQDKMDEFVKFCHELKLDPAHVLEEIDINRAPLPMMLSASGTGVEKCMAWFLRNMIPGEEYSASVVQRRARDSGYTNYAINNAKADLGIVSKRSGSRWVWTLPGVPIKESPPETAPEVESIKDNEVDVRKVPVEDLAQVFETISAQMEELV